MRRAAQAGLTLVELLVALALAALLAAPLAAAVQASLRSQAAASEANDVVQQARFAMRRMQAAVRATAPKTLGSTSAKHTGDWFSPVAFCQKDNALRETVPADHNCSGGVVIASNATNLNKVQINAGPGAAQVVELQVSIVGPAGTSIVLTSRTRMGGGML